MTFFAVCIIVAVPAEGEERFAVDQCYIVFIDPHFAFECRNFADDRFGFCLTAFDGYKIFAVSSFGKIAGKFLYRRSGRFITSPLSPVTVMVYGLPANSLNSTFALTVLSFIVAKRVLRYFG